MKHSKVLALVLAVILSMMCVVFSACGTNLAASASGIGAENAAEEQADSELEESEDEYSEDAELQEDEDAEDYDSEADDVVETAADNNETYEIVFNSNPSRKRYHLPTCRGVDDISEEHYKEYTLTKEEIKDKQDNDDWIPCGWCHPDREFGIEE